jgi:hypothetical protein
MSEHMEKTIEEIVDRIGRDMNVVNGLCAIMGRPPRFVGPGFTVTPAVVGLPEMRLDKGGIHHRAHRGHREGKEEESQKARKPESESAAAEVQEALTALRPAEVTDEGDRTVARKMMEELKAFTTKVLRKALVGKTEVVRDDKWVSKRIWCEIARGRVKQTGFGAFAWVEGATHPKERTKVAQLLEQIRTTMGPQWKVSELKAKLGDRASAHGTKVTVQRLARQGVIPILTPGRPLYEAVYGQPGAAEESQKVRKPESEGAEVRGQRSEVSKGPAPETGFRQQVGQRFNLKESDMSMAMRRAINVLGAEFTLAEIFEKLEAEQGERVVNGWRKGGGVPALLTQWREAGEVTLLRREPPAQTAVYGKGLKWKGGTTNGHE